MKQIYKINNSLDVPIYQQLVDFIRSGINKGELVAGERLPTVQEMTKELSIARGTVKRAYDELERAGFIEKVQGRGTFVCYRPANSASRKEQAMAAIDSVLNKLDDMGFSAAEINIFLNLKLRERAKEAAQVKVAVVECNPENLSQVSEQMRHIDGVDLYSYTVDSIKQYPYKLGEDFDIVVTTASHYEYIKSVVANKKKRLCVALRPSAHCLAQIIKLRAGKRVGIIGYSLRFAQLLHSTCQDYAEGILLADAVAAGEVTDIKKYLEDKDVLLVPERYEQYFSSDQAKRIRDFEGQVVECNYELDEGSVLYLETKIKRLLEDRII